MRQLKITKSITNRESQSLDKYLQEIGREDLATAEEEVSLAKRIREGDESAVERLTKANLRFVVSVAKQYQNQGMQLPDLVNSGNIGLVKAVRRFDETRGFKFISYAVWWIRQSILHALAEETRMVRLPLNQIGTLNKVKKAFSQLEQEFEREPSLEELADLLGLPEDKLRDSANVSGRHVSMDEVVPNTDDASWWDITENKNAVPSDKVLMDESLKTELDRVMMSLSSQEKTVLKYCFGLEGERALSLEEIGEKMGGLSRERIRQIKEKAVRRLKHPSKTRLLKKYLG